MLEQFGVSIETNLKDLPTSPSPHNQAMFRPRLVSALPVQCLRQVAIPRDSRYLLRQVASIHTILNNKENVKQRIPPPRRISFSLPKLTTADIPNIKTFLERIGRDATKECEDKIKVPLIICAD